MPRSAPTQTAAELAAENASLRAQLQEHEEVAFYCWARLVDYDGYYNPQTRKGDVEGLARIIDDVLETLKTGKTPMQRLEESDEPIL